MRTKGIDVKNSCNITQEERNAFMERFKTVCRQRGTTVAAIQIKLGKANAYFRNMGYISEFIGEEIKEYICNTQVGRRRRLRILFGTVAGLFLIGTVYFYQNIFSNQSNPCTSYILQVVQM